MEVALSLSQLTGAIPIASSSVLARPISGSYISFHV